MLKLIILSPKNGRNEVTIQLIRQVTVMQSLAILLVVIGHSNPPSTFIAVPGWSLFIERWIYSFHMPLFIFISGFLFVKTNRGQNYLAFCKKKIIRLMVPYVFFIILTTVLKGLFSRFTAYPIELSPKVLIHSLLFPLDAVTANYWFLATLICILLFFYPIYIEIPHMKFTKISLWTIIFVGMYLWNPISNFTFFAFNRLFGFSIFFWLGCVAAKYETYLTDFLNDKRTFIGSLIILVILNIIGNNILNFTSPFVGIVMSWSFCNLYIDNNWTFLELLNGKYYCIYLFNAMLVLVVGGILRSSGLGFFAYYFGVLIAGGLIPVMIYNIVKRMKLDRIFLVRIIFGI